MDLSFIDFDVGVYNELGEERVSPRSGKIYYKPVVSLKPVKGMVFDSVELAYGFYVSYAHASGFSVRKNSAYTNNGLLKLKYYVCSKEGFKSGKDHNHSFVHKDDIQFLTSARRVDYVKESVIQALSQVNLGPVRAFNILKSLYGGYEQVGAIKNDFKNFKTRQSEYISEYDADMADENSKKSYLVFGDVVGFDATYRSNKYDMVFVRFTGIDNHNRNITLGAALLGSETADSYRWLLREYAHAFGSAPKVVVTDQDAAMKRAIQDVFPNSRHRLCMWHIWEKVTSKVGPATPNVAKFKEKLADIVWTNSITTDEFEEKWPSILSEYGLSDHEWLVNLYKIRKDWMPAYYLQENFFGVMRTTSRSENENHFFNQFCNPRSTLVEFFSHFEATVECQWYEHRGNDHHSRYTIPGYVSRISFVTEFPKKYIIRRWKKEAISNASLSSFRPEEFGENRADVEAVLRQIRFAHEYKINKLVSNKEQMCLYREYVKDYMSKADEAQVVAPPPAGEIDLQK
ncbi:protein FAR1-RELATED SEQUENCE 5-like [Bidens hawaiensis]|uniref:protein FAR1-RELATED SEQUENCE 5-like n=1 Tax=Bidens hawaiensis TaxID=980011 RepID=UPI004049D117